MSKHKKGILGLVLLVMMGSIGCSDSSSSSKEDDAPNLHAKVDNLMDKLRPPADIAKDKWRGPGDDLMRTVPEQLTALGKDAVPSLISKLKDDDKFVRMAAVMAMATMGPKARDAVPALVIACRDEDGTVGMFARVALHQKVGPAPKACLPALIELVKPRKIPKKYGYPPDSVFYDTDVLLALGNMGPDAADAVPTIVGVLQSSNPSDRRCAVSVLGAIGAAAVPSLEKLQTDSDAEIKKQATEAIKMIKTDLAKKKTSKRI